MVGESARRVGRPGPYRLVIADDDEDLRELVRAMVLTGAENEFVVVAEATNGLDAVAIASAHRPDLVLLDLSMPGMDGLRVIAEIRERCPLTNILVFSGFDVADGGPRAMAAGAHAYLIKGAPRNELLTALRSALQGLESGPINAEHTP